MLVRDGQFRKAIDSERTGCVEVAAMLDGSVLIRDSKNTEGSVLSFTEHEWHVFVAAVKSGEFE
jgi:hypothetical protein